MDEKHRRTTTSDDRSHGSTSVHLNMSSSELAALDRSRRYNIDDISMSRSPVTAGPRLFRPGMLFSSKTYERSFSAVYKSPHPIEYSDEDKDQNQGEDDRTSEDQRDLQDILNESREQEMQLLAQSSVSQRPGDDDMAEFIINELDLRIANANAVGNMDVDEIVELEQAPISPVISTQNSYPPINQTGIVQEHDLPFIEYGHLDQQTIAQQFAFNLQPFPNQPPPDRYHAKSFAIISSTNVPKNDVMAKIQDAFLNNRIQYICIGEDTSELSQQPRLHIQIIFRDQIDRRKPLIDDITGTPCNYQVTSNDRAWNEYIKKGGQFIEFGEFKSVKRHSQRQWPSSSRSSTTAAAAATLPSPPPIGLTPLPPSSASTTRTTTTPNQQQLSLLPRATTTTTIARPTTVRAQAEERRQREDDIAREALGLAERSVDQAMDYIREQKPNKFMHHSKWYQEAFKYVNLRAQHFADRRGAIDKEYIWPDSFPECTPQLRAVVERWIRHHFYRVKRARCLILIGPTGTGKTSFALSLPGQVNYFQGHWNLDNWSDYARYSVYDDIPWAKFGEKGYPSIKGLLTQNGKMGATGKYRSVVTINVQQPAIVLMNREDAGSLVGLLKLPTEEGTLEYWHKRATIYEMGADEYFYKRTNRGEHSSSTASSMSTNDNRLGDPDEV